MADLPPGESGPRRKTPYPTSSDAANAEAQRIARDLGVQTSSSPPRPWFRRQKATAAAASVVADDFLEPLPPSDYTRLPPPDDSRPTYVPPSVVDPPPPVVYEFDQHGQRAPYKEGPFILSRDQIGRLVKKRWCA